MARAPGFPGEDRPDFGGGAPFPGWELLRGRSPREVLRRLADGDPLEIGARSDEHLREQALLLEPARLHLRTMANSAYAAIGYAGAPPLGEWLRECIRVSAIELLEEDFEQHAAGIPVRELPGARASFYQELLGLEPTLARAASIAFNRLPARTRRVGWEVLVEGRTLEECARAGHGARDEVHSRLRDALRALGRNERGCDPPGGRHG